MMTAGFCTNIWVPLFTFPAVEAPEWKHGYPAATVFLFAMWVILMFGTWFMARWKNKNPDLEMQLAREQAIKDSEAASEGGTDGEGKRGIAATKEIILQDTSSGKKE